MEPWSRRALWAPMIIAGVVLLALILPPFVVLAIAVVLTVVAVLRSKRGRRFARRFIR